jgi:RHS repeat-associated protein
MILPFGRLGLEQSSAWAADGTGDHGRFLSKRRCPLNSVQNLPSKYLWAVCPSWGATNNNGNLLGETAYAGGSGPLNSLAQTNRSYGYDAFNRLTSGNDSGGWSRSFGYDAYGNMWVTAASGVALAGNTPTSNVYNGSNQIAATSYDAAGNQVTVNGDVLAYDAENRVALAMEPASLGGGTENYIYDGDGRRVGKWASSSATLYVYDAFGQLTAEYTTAANNPTCTTCYFSSDHLGSTRLVTDQTGAVVARHDYLPFGEETTVNTADNINQKFTGKERDSESGLDYFGARYYGSALGRFTSPDPISGTVLHILNPQRWNMYAYAVNSPLSYLDLDGRDAIAVKFGNGAHGLGHAGVASVHHDGKGRFADFGPQHPGNAHDAGKYNVIDFKTQVVYGADGKPTKESLSALANELADDEQQPHDSVSVAYFKTSDAETVALDAYIDAANNQRLQGKTPAYWGGFRDRISFCMNGLQKAGVGQGSSILTIPNLQYLNFWLWADQTATGTNPKPDPEKDRQAPHGRCLQTRDGNCVAQ